MEDAIKQIIFFRKNEVNAEGMLDIYHFVAHSIKTFKTHWPKIVEELKLFFLQKDYQGKQFFSGIHFPIGTRLDDSLPIDNMNDEMLKLFARKIIPHVERVVFENQQKNLGLFFSTKKMLEEQKARNKIIIERFKITGIIS